MEIKSNNFDFTLFELEFKVLSYIHDKTLNASTPDLKFAVRDIKGTSYRDMALVLKRLHKYNLIHEAGLDMSGETHVEITYIGRAFIKGSKQVNK